jgi:hypothetical protein
MSQADLAAAAGVDARQIRRYANPTLINVPVTKVHLP